MEVSDLNATIVSKYLTTRLRQRFQLKEVLMPLLRYLTNSSFVKGFRISCAGRFTRKEIALYDVRTYSSVPFSGSSLPLDFSLSEVILKYSICGVKVWLHRNFLSEHSFGIRGIGMNFLLMPPFAEEFFDLLTKQEKNFSIYYRPSFLDKKIFNRLKKNENQTLENRKKRFLNFSALFSPVFDFHFFRFFPEIKTEKGNVLKKKITFIQNNFSEKSII